jgi:thiamine biosynthesis lipoprotein
VEQVMGITVSIHLRGDGVDGVDAERGVALAFRTMREMDRIFPTHRLDSDLMRLRRQEIDLSACSSFVREAMAIGAEAERLTHGAFTTLLPPGGDLAFDPIGFVTGWAVDLAARPLSRLPWISFCINAGGDFLIGSHSGLPVAEEDAIAWRVGIEDPHDRSRIANIVSLTQGAVATCGTTLRGVPPTTRPPRGTSPCGTWPLGAMRGHVKWPSRR